jgi:tight adherence protein B
MTGADLPLFGLALLMVLLATAALVAGTAAASILARRRRLRARAHMLRPIPAKAGRGAAKRGAVLFAGDRRGSIDALLETHLDAGGTLRSALASAGLATTLSRFFLLCVAAAFIVTLLLHALGLQGLPLLLAGVIVLAGLPTACVHLLRARRRRRFEALLPDAIGLMVRGLRSGVPIAESVAEVSRQIPEPVQTVFRRVHDQSRLGQPMETALRQEARLLGLPSFDFLVVSLSIQKETGGNLAETLEGLAEVVRRRQQLALKVRALSSEARASALIIGSLPLAMAGMMMAMAPDYMAPLFGTPAGQMMLAIAILSLLVGAVAMSAIVRLDG